MSAMGRKLSRQLWVESYHSRRYLIEAQALRLMLKVMFFRHMAAPLADFQGDGYEGEQGHR